MSEAPARGEPDGRNAGRSRVLVGEGQLNAPERDWRASLLQRDAPSSLALVNSFYGLFLFLCLAAVSDAHDRLPIDHRGPRTCDCLRMQVRGSSIERTSSSCCAPARSAAWPSVTSPEALLFSVSTVLQRAIAVVLPNP